MAVTVETLEKLERKITLTLPVDVIAKEVDSRLKRLSRQVKVDGFRPGKVPMNIIGQRYGYQVQYEVMNDKVGEVFNAAATEANLRVAGQPRISEKEGAIDKTVDILRKQRRTFAQRSAETPAEEGDRVTIDFEGKIDGEPFQGGKAEAFQFLIGEGQMLKEFEEAVLGMKFGESKTFPLNFPEDYHGKDVAGKQADFLVTLKKLEAAHLPEVTDELAKSLGVSEASVEGLRKDIKANLEREVKSRLMGRNKQAALQALVDKAELDLPKSSVQSEVDRMVEGARADLKARGIKDADKAPIPDDVFRPQAEKRVRMGLVVADLVRAQNLQATPEKIKAHIEELASSYEKPAEVVRWYYSDMSRLGEVEATVIENNVTEYIMSHAKVNEKAMSFDELMGQQ